MSLFFAAALSLAAQQPTDTTYARLVREATTDPHFLPASVATVPLSTTIPSPSSTSARLPALPA